jgi:ElaB/YqjD/DUF883 family membrane-anchored ribosome-binding protein
MKRHTPEYHDYDLGSLDDEANALLAATADATDENTPEAGACLADVIERGRAAWVRAQDQTMEGAKATDRAIRERPYHAITLALSVGTILGVLLFRRK